jgi:hypothetical protein
MGLEVRWAIAGALRELVTLSLFLDGQYRAFGLSGDFDSSV